MSKTFKQVREERDNWKERFEKANEARESAELEVRSLRRLVNKDREQMNGYMKRSSDLKNENDRLQTELKSVRSDLEKSKEREHNWIEKYETAQDLLAEREVLVRFAEKMISISRQNLVSYLGGVIRLRRLIRKSSSENGEGA